MGWLCKLMLHEKVFEMRHHKLSVNTLQKIVSSRYETRDALHQTEYKWLNLYYCSLFDA